MYEGKVITASVYHLHHTDKDGVVHSIELTGDETITTGCPQCGREHSMDLYGLFDVMKEGDLFGTSVYCAVCSKKAAEERQKSE